MTTPSARHFRPGWAIGLCLIWALIYLPGLGQPEYKGEEPRRVQPAVFMLDYGQWALPHVGGESYYNKPPFINWCIAGAMQLSQRRDEWAARSVSVLAVLATGLLIYFSLQGWSGPRIAALCSILFLTHIGLMEKGRLIEIEALYTLFIVGPMTLWLGAWARSRPQPWLVIGLLLGLGVLTKGPLNVLLFYAFVLLLTSPWRFSWRTLRQQMLPLALTLLPTAAWVTLLFLGSPEPEKIWGTWFSQVSVRVTGQEGQGLSHLVNIPRSLSNFLPWLTFVPLLFTPKAPSALPCSDRVWVRLRWLSLVGVVGLCLVPGILPRYVQPLLWLPSLLLAWRLMESPAWLGVWRNFLVASWIILSLAAASLAVIVIFFDEIPVDLVGLAGFLMVLIALGYGGRKALSAPLTAPRLVVLSALIMAAVAWGYTAAVIPQLAARDSSRPIVQKLTESLSSEDQLQIYRPGLRDFVSYLPPKTLFPLRPSEIQAGWLLIRSEQIDRLPVNRFPVIVPEWEWSDSHDHAWQLIHLSENDSAESELLE
ncbi:MAG: ArnT family glycosyltransferase [Verrucomicrobiales bacterium]